jgi:hypothetical protein
VVCQELSRNKHNDIPLKLALESQNYNFLTKKTNKQNRFQELIHPEDTEFVNVFGKYIFSLKHNDIPLKL